MRFQNALVVTIILSINRIAQADGFVYRLPEDGTWSRYTIKQTTAEPMAEKFIEESILTLASVGQETFKDEVCRWIEIVVEAKQRDGRMAKSVFKILCPEKRAKKGEDPLMHYVKGWARFGEKDPQALNKDLLSHPAMTLVNTLMSGPPKEIAPLPTTEIVTKLGKLTCEGQSGSLILKGAAINFRDSKVPPGDLKLRLNNYFHDKAPFGVVTSHLEVEFPDMGRGKHSTEADFALIEVGKGAKSELPDKK